MSQFMTIVEAAKNGSMHADVGSGMRVMSDSLIALQPAIEEPSNTQAVGERIFVDERLVERHVLPFAARVGETEIDIFDVIVLDRLQDILGGLHGLPFLKIKLVFPARRGGGG